MSEKPIEIYDLAVELNKLAASGVLRPHTRQACSQAAALLVQMREVILTGRDPKAALADLHELMVKQGEG